MNIELIKNEIETKIGSNVRIKVNGLRNKTHIYVGKITSAYPYIFTVLVDGENKSFSYADVITGEIEINYQ